jgi:hypothetical protein
MLKAVVASGTRTLVAGRGFWADNVKAMDISSPQIAVFIGIQMYACGISCQLSKTHYKRAPLLE